MVEGHSGGKMLTSWPPGRRKVEEEGVWRGRKEGRKRGRDREKERKHVLADFLLLVCFILPLSYWMVPPPFRAHLPHLCAVPHA